MAKSVGIRGRQSFVMNPFGRHSEINFFESLVCDLIRNFFIGGMFYLPFGYVVAEESLRDPTRPLIAKRVGVASKAKLVLQAVYDRNGKKTAVINGNAVKLGDRVQGAIVVGIFSKSVSLEKDGKSTRLSLRPTIR